MSDWPVVKLSAIVEITSSKRVKRADYVEFGVPFYRSKEVIERSKGNDISTELFITEDHFEKIKSKFGAPEEGDILLTSVGTLGVPYQVKCGDRFYFKDGNLTWFRNFRDRVNPKYLYYWLTSSIAKRKFDEITIGSTQKALTIVALKSIELELPPIETQNVIVKMLDSLDGKLTNNRQTNQTLEQIAQAIFKSWFVDFEPTRAKIAAKQNGQDTEHAAMAAISGKTLDQLDQLISDANAQGSADAAGGGSPGATLQQLKTTAALFPDALVDSELGEIPEGWEVKDLKELALKISKGTTPRKTVMKEAGGIQSIPFLKVRDISDDGEITRIGLDMIPDSVHSGVLKRSMLKTNDLLFSIAGTIGRVAFIEEDLSNSNCNQAVAFVRLIDPGKYLKLCRLNLVGSRIQDEVRSKVVQGVQANFSLTSLGEIKIIIPQEKLLLGFNKYVGDISNKKMLLLSENRKLSELRDVLLPKILSGELNIDLELKEAN